MPLEESLDALTTALNRNSDILERGLKKAGAAPAAAAPAKPGPKPAAGRKPAAAKVPTEDDIRTAFGGYLAVKDKTELSARKENVRAILNHFGVSYASEIPEESRGEALGYVTQLEAGETPDFMNEPGEESGESLL